MADLTTSSAIDTFLQASTVAAARDALEADFLAKLHDAEISVTGAVTATIGRMHVCSGTSADYTVTLPAASGNTGKFIGFRMASGLTKLVTLDGNSAETIDGLTTRIMRFNESAILFCDGSNWFKVAGRSVPMYARARYENGGTTRFSYGDNSYNVIPLTIAESNADGLWSSSATTRVRHFLGNDGRGKRNFGWRIDSLRPGARRVHGHAHGRPGPRCWRRRPHRRLPAGHERRSVPPVQRQRTTRHDLRGVPLVIYA
jgi:hypothetical protein